MTYILPARRAWIPPLGGRPLDPPRDPRFAPAPAELCQLAAVYDAEKPPRGGAWVMEEKHDGIRLLWLGGELVTRNGAPFAAAEHLRPMFERIETRCGLPMMLDAEYVAAPRRPGQSGFLATLAAFRAGEPGAGTAFLFDGMPLGDWQGGGCPRPLDHRRRRLEGAFDGLRAGPVSLVEQWPGGEDMAIVTHRLRRIWARGGEGLMLKRRDSPYERRRAASWLKAKREMRLAVTVADVLNEGAALRVLFEGRKLRVAVPPALRGSVAPGDNVTVAAMEWTEAGALRQGRLVAPANEADI